MNIGIVGAAGKAGSRIMAEALDRGHNVTAIVRDANRVSAAERVSVVAASVFDLTPGDLDGMDVVVNAFGAPLGAEHLHVEAGNALIRLLEGNPNTRLIVVGGAGSLYVDEARTTRVVDTAGFPPEYKATALNQAENLSVLRRTNDLRWTFVSPSAHFAIGRRTGSYRTGTEWLLVDGNGESYVSYEDYAVAILDEIEYPRHIRERFTVGSESA